MKSVFLFFMFIALLVSGHLRAEDVESAGNKGIISGRVIDGQNLALPGASVFIRSLQKGVVTDNNGNYRILGLDPGDFILSVSYVGYKTVEKKVTIKEKSVIKLDIQLSENEIIGEVVVKGHAGGGVKSAEPAINRPKHYECHLIRSGE